MSATLLVVLAHPDDEVPCAGTLLAQRARGDRVVVVWLSRGEMTEAFGPLPADEVGERRVQLGADAARLLGVEHRFLSFPDTGIQATPAAALELARVICEIRPTGLLTWGTSWVRGGRHPDHEATGKIARDAVTLARIAKVVAPLAPVREWCPVFTYRDLHSTLPPAAVDVEPYVPKINELADLYRHALGFGDAAWLERRLRRAGSTHGLVYAEVFDAWESLPGVYATLLPAPAGDFDVHPDRAARG